MLKFAAIMIEMVLVISAFTVSISCATGGGAAMSNAGGTQPINPTEAVEYQQALLRCNKTGGSRIIKIEGSLRCF